MNKEINYALVEETRPPIYTAMKYWGKKPHNIWSEYIKTYTPVNGVCLDPFMGSGIAFFEAIRCKRKVIGFDINPLSAFIVEVLTSNFNKDIFEKEVNNIIEYVNQDEIYQKIYTTTSRYGNGYNIVQHFKWDKGNIYQLGIIDDRSKKNNLETPNEHDIRIVNFVNGLDIPFTYPNDPFPASPSFSANFIAGIGGNNFSNIWTKRNLYVISLIFNKIKTIKGKAIQLQILFGFIQMLHLTTKMNVPRREEAKRDFSTSWGRSAYICAKRQMEMNPLLVFKSSCFGKQSVESALKIATKYLDLDKIKIKQVNIANKDRNNTGFNAKYGTIDVCSIDQYIPEKSIDFIITDPPYGGLVQYLDLSYIWLSWLKEIDKKYIPNFDAEIVVKKGKIDISLYQQRLTHALKQLHRVLKDDGKIVFTFHNKEIKIWNSFLHSIKEAGFFIEKVIHQQNMRTGESVVANPYGTSGTDFYIRCTKSNLFTFNNDQEAFNSLVLKTAIIIIAKRQEPTPYQILFNGILAEISQSGFRLDDFDAGIDKVLTKYTGSIFKIEQNIDNLAGAFWWFIEPKKHITDPDKPLSQRVEETILDFLKRKQSTTFDEVLGEIFTRYPNGLTPVTKQINSILKKYAVQSSGKWLYNKNIEAKITEHTKIIKLLLEIGKKLGKKTFVGKREQRERIEGIKLSNHTDYNKLDFLDITFKNIQRLEMVDIIWISDSKIDTILEVENSTNFISALLRASNCDIDTPKIMIIPDTRQNELLSYKDKMFLELFKNNNWKYLLYSDVEKLSRSLKPNIKIFLKTL